jgi:hypothetical protein
MDLLEANREPNFSFGVGDLILAKLTVLRRGEKADSGTWSDD